MKYGRKEFFGKYAKAVPGNYDAQRENGES